MGREYLSTKIATRGSPSSVIYPHQTLSLMFSDVKPVHEITQNIN